MIEVYWAVGDPDHLQHETIEDAILDYLDSYYTQWGREIVVEEYKRAEITDKNKERIAEQVLTDALQFFDEYYGPEDDYVEATNSMVEAANTFIAAIVKDYPVYRCEQTGNSVTINVEGWIRANEPDLINDLETNDWGDVK